MDELLIGKAKDGDREALAKLLYYHYEIVFKYLIKFTLDYSLAEELVQETMVRAIEKIQLFDEKKSKFSTWLVTIAQHLFFDRLRKKKVEKTVLLEEGVIPWVPKEGPNSGENFDEMLKALSKLSEEVRTPILLKHYYGYSLEEIAGKMAIPIGTVKSRIHNGLKLLRKELALDG